MVRFPFIAGGGLALLYYDAVNYPWSPHSLFDTQYLFGTSPGNGSIFLLVLLFFRLSVLLFLTTAFYQAAQWRYYLGATEIRPIWTDDFNPDAY